MANKLTFSLVSPERELFSGEVDQVDIPGTEGDLGILPDHSPLMAAIRTGAITVYADGQKVHYFVKGGFADATAEGLTIFAEQAAALDDLTVEHITEEIATLSEGLSKLDGEARFAAQQNLDGLNAVASML